MAHNSWIHVALSNDPVLVCTKTEDSVESKLWSATQTQNILCYLAESNTRGIAPENIMVATGINELNYLLVVSDIISLFKSILMDYKLPIISWIY